MYRSRSLGFASRCSITRSTCRSRVSTECGSRPSSPYWWRSSEVNAVPLLRMGSSSNAKLRGRWEGGVLMVWTTGFLLASDGLVAGCSSHGQDGKRAHALRAMNEDALDVRRRGWAGVETSIVAGTELRPAISAVQIEDNVGGIEKDDQVL